MIVVRPEEPSDIAAIHALTEIAFGKRSVADLNDRLRDAGKAALSLVAVADGDVVGHVLFSSVEFEGAKGVALGPIAVAESHRMQGIARAMIETGLETLRAEGWDFAMLLGSPDLYPRFGFRPGIGFGIESDYDVPDDEFMILELRPDSLLGRSGVAAFAPEFRDA